jgi:predicted SnoaL-like aldol condensation-catalyzing enzyme
METRTHVTNKERAAAVIAAVGTRDEGAAAYIDPEEYIQHQPLASDGVAAFIGFLRSQPPGGYRTRVVRAFEDGDYVFTHSEGDFGGPTAFFDIFRFRNGLIVEHWDNMQRMPAESVSGHSMIDGPTEASDLDRTEANKSLVRDLIDEVFLGQHWERLPEFISREMYIQHNPSVGDGLEGLQAGMAAMAEAGITMTFSETHLVLGEGDFVLAQSAGTFAGGDATFYDLFRVAGGKVVEHWDVIEPLTPADQWRNSNGKF